MKTLPRRARTAASRVERASGYQFKNPALLLRALVHRSYAHENGAPETNEELEFLGDAVLGFLVAERIFRKRSTLDEGAMTNLRASLVNRRRLAAEAERIGLGPAMLLGRGEESSGGRQKVSVLSDAFEALVGAIFLDGGVRPVRSVVGKLFGEDIDAAPARGATSADSKTRLQEWAQARGWGLPKYRLVASAGPDHAREFVVEVVVGGQAAGAGAGPSKRRAEQQAAGEALLHLGASSQNA